MQFIRSAVASMLVSLLLVTSVTPALASASTTLPPDTGEQMIDTEETAEVTGLNDLSVQLDDLYHLVGDNLKIDYLYVKILHLIAGGKAVYADALPNINIDTTIDSLPGAFDIDGTKQEYGLMAPWVYCSDDSVTRPSKYYLPDAAYSVTADVVKLMNERYYFDRGNLQVYFDALSMDVKTNIVFCEAVLEYIGSNQEDVNSFYSIYEKLIYDKETDENVLEYVANGQFVFKDKFKQILVDNGISEPRQIEVLSIILSFDSKLAASSSTNEISEAYILPYQVGYTSRENMMIAAMSIVGKVRYVWGGGHGGTGSIRGINPMWDIFYKAYPTTEDEYGYSKCIKPSTSWCPLHGEYHNANSCLFASDKIRSVDDYINERSELDISSIQDDKFRNLIENSKIPLEHGIDSHRLDGLDCSGYASWVFNQVVSNPKYDSGAMRFISQSGIDSLGLGVKLLPGDVFSWGDHIVVIVGPESRNSDAYVMVESGPNTVKFGVVYYASAKPRQISSALNIAIEANKLLGNLPDSERTRMFNMDKCVYSDEEDEEWYGYHDIGRLSATFIDENTILSDYGCKITEMTAQEIIQHTINNFTYQYVSGIDTYDGELFTLDKVYENSKIDVENSETLPALELVDDSNEVMELTDELGTSVNSGTLA